MDARMLILRLQLTLLRVSVPIHCAELDHTEHLTVFSHSLLNKQRIARTVDDNDNCNEYINRESYRQAKHRHDNIEHSLDEAIRHAYLWKIILLCFVGNLLYRERWPNNAPRY